MKITALALTLLLAGWAGSIQAQAAAADSITIDRAIRLTLANQPVIRQAEYGVAASSARIEVNRSDRYPDVSIEGAYTRIGPVPQFELPGQGPLELAPFNNYDIHVGLRQTLYDFGKTDAGVKLAETSKQTAADYIDLVKSNLAYQTIDVFNSILILHKRIDVLDEQLQALNQHLEMSVKKVQAGTATDFDTLTITVRIAVARSDRIDAAHALETREIMFRQLTGLPPDQPMNLSGTFLSGQVEFDPDTLTAVALRQRPELVLARDAETSATAQSHLVSLGDKPRLDLSFITGLKNGYEPNLNTWRGNFAAGLQVKIPVFNGHRTKHEVTEADANLNSSRAHTSDLERKILSEVRQAIAGVNSNLEKIKSTDTQVSQAEEALAMARHRYDAGVITNLDLLDAETTLSQTKLIRLRALYDYTASLSALEKAIGNKRW